jgi:Zn-finger nucleic acid-binding protein
MLLVEYEQIEIDYCPDCGVWLDAGELELLLAEAGGESTDTRADDGASDASDADEPVKCPVCRAVMNKGRYDDVSSSVVDRCPWEHGIWFDRGELGEIVKAHTASGAAGGSAVTSFLVNLFGEG